MAEIRKLRPQWWNLNILPSVWYPTTLPAADYFLFYLLFIFSEKYKTYWTISPNSTQTQTHTHKFLPSASTRSFRTTISPKSIFPSNESPGAQTLSSSVWADTRRLMRPRVFGLTRNITVTVRPEHTHNFCVRRVSMVYSVERFSDNRTCGVGKMVIF